MARRRIADFVSRKTPAIFLSAAALSRTDSALCASPRGTQSFTPPAAWPKCHAIVTNSESSKVYSIPSPARIETGIANENIRRLSANVKRGHRSKNEKGS